MPTGSGSSSRFFGLYRARVVSNADPVARMRLQVEVPALGGAGALIWAEACIVPGATAVPAIGTGVWIEFEGGDPSHPVWIGTMWSDRKGGEPPAERRA